MKDMADFDECSGCGKVHTKKSEGGYCPDCQRAMDEQWDSSIVTVLFDWLQCQLRRIFNTTSHAARP